MAVLLIVEDDTATNEAICEYMSSAGHTTLSAFDGEQGLQIAREKSIDLVVLDIMLPKRTGLEVLKELRQTSGIPVLMLTALDDEPTQAASFDEQADDYITKPFNPLELVARGKTQLRRYTRYNQADAAAPKPPEAERDIRGLVINRETHKCTLYGKAVQLTPIEFSILWYLCENQGRVVSSEELFEAVWGEKFLDNNNTVMAHIGRLREKLGEPPRKPRFIKTVWGVGYQVE